MIDDYTHVLEVAAELEEGPAQEDAVAKLIAHLKSEGRMKMLPQIVHELKKINARRLLRASVLEVASEKESARAKKEAAAAGIAVTHTKVNHDLISGWRVLSGNKLVDHSAKRALLDIYKKVIA
jgi:F0F1-type ATP synthase delta subunit